MRENDELGSNLVNPDVQRQYREVHNFLKRSTMWKTFGKQMGHMGAELLAGQAADVACEVGCGLGTGLSELVESCQIKTLYALDRSFEMVRFAQKSLFAQGIRAAWVTADVCHLPFKSGSLDLVLARHMLYHVRPVDLALIEIRRVLKEGGTVLITTVTPETTKELFDIHNSVIATFDGARSVAPMSVGFRTVYADTILGKYFSIRQVRMYQATLEFRQVDDVVDYYATMPMYQQAFEDGEKRSEFLRAVRSRIASCWGSAPTFVVNNAYGAYVAQKVT